MKIIKSDFFVTFFFYFLILTLQITIVASEDVNTSKRYSNFNEKDSSEYHSKSTMMHNVHHRASISSKTSQLASGIDKDDFQEM